LSVRETSLSGRGLLLGSEDNSDFLRSSSELRNDVKETACEHSEDRAVNRDEQALPSNSARVSLSYLLTTPVQSWSLDCCTRDMQRFRCSKPLAGGKNWWSRSVGMIGEDWSTTTRAHPCFGGLELLVVRSRYPRRRHA
jgi:hypothetical protein